jgi:hypothetical protein
MAWCVCWLYSVGAKCEVLVLEPCGVCGSCEPLLGRVRGCLPLASWLPRACGPRIEGRVLKAHLHAGEVPPVASTLVGMSPLYMDLINSA